MKAFTGVLKGNTITFDNAPDISDRASPVRVELRIVGDDDDVQEMIRMMEEAHMGGEMLVQSREEIHAR